MTLNPKALEAATHHITGGSTFDADDRLEIATGVITALKLRARVAHMRAHWKAEPRQPPQAQSDEGFISRRES